MIKQSLFNGDNRHLVDAIVPRSPCNKCMKSDVCMYKSDIEKNIKEIGDLLWNNEILGATFTCKKKKCNVEIQVLYTENYQNINYHVKERIND